MGLLDFLKKSSPPPDGPYRDAATNRIYELLFADDVELYRDTTKEPYSYPFDILLDTSPMAFDLQKIIADECTEPRIKALAYRLQRNTGHTPANKELLAVIVEVGLDEGLDVLACYANGTARYINYTGKLLVWEMPDDPEGKALTDDLFAKSREILMHIGPWNKPRRPHPSKGSVRISFIVSDGLYFGEGPINIMFKGSMAGPALNTATGLMRYVIKRSLEAGQMKA
jgi:hypothetical protein